MDARPEGWDLPVAGALAEPVMLAGMPREYATRPGLLDALGALPFEYRWTARWIGLDKADAETEIVKLRKRWPGTEFALQPLARIDEAEERAWAAEWIAEAVALAGVEIMPRVREEVWTALGALAEAPPHQRTLTVFCALCQDRAVSAALEPLTLKGAHGTLLDAAHARLTLSRFECFELESLMATPSVTRFSPRSRPTN